MTQNTALSKSELPILCSCDLNKNNQIMELGMCWVFKSCSHITFSGNHVSELVFEKAPPSSSKLPDPQLTKTWYDSHETATENIEFHPKSFSKKKCYAVDHGVTAAISHFTKSLQKMLTRSTIHNMKKEFLPIKSEPAFLNKAECRALMLLSKYEGDVKTYIQYI